MTKDYYLTLHVKSDATTEEIKAAYGRLALEARPDRSVSGSDPFLEIQEAYSVLGDPRQRALYDEKGEQIRVARSPVGRSKAEQFDEQAWNQPLQLVQPMPRTASIFESPKPASRVSVPAGSQSQAGFDAGKFLRSLAKTHQR